MCFAELTKFGNNVAAVCFEDKFGLQFHPLIKEVSFYNLQKEGEQIMAHFFSESGFTVIQFFGYRFEVIDRKRNPVLSTTVFPCYGPREFRIWKYAVKFGKV